MRAMPFLGLFLGLFPAGQAVAADSVYTHHIWEKCRTLKDDGIESTKRCVGPGGLPILYENEPDSAFVSFGAKGFVGDGVGVDLATAPGATVEWRRDKGAPFAAILRYAIGKGVGAPHKDHLVVYKLEGRRSSCIVAIVAAARADANARARAIADERARAFACGKDAIIKE